MNTTTRPSRITLAATVHLIIAVLFLIVPVVGLGYGSEVQAAAEAAFAEQEVSTKVLAANGISFAETGSAITIPAVVAVALTVLALLILSGKRTGRTLALIFLPILLLLEAYIVYSQIYAAELVGTALAATGDPALADIDAKPVMDAADAAYPGWLNVAVAVRHVAVPLGAVIAFVLLLGSQAKAYFRKAR